MQFEFLYQLALERVMLWTALNAENENRRWHSRPRAGGNE
jgi:hypothetical protein